MAHEVTRSAGWVYKASGCPRAARAGLRTAIVCSHTDRWVSPLTCPSLPSLSPPSSSASKNSVALSKIYGYPDNADPLSFGVISNRASVAAAWQALCEALATGGRTVDIEALSAAAHDGWGAAVLAHWDAAAYGPRTVAYSVAEVPEVPEVAAATAAGRGSEEEA